MFKRIIYLAIVTVFLGFTTGLQAQEEASAVSLYNQGLELLKTKKYAEAFPLMEQAIEKADTASESDLQVIQLAKKNGAIAAYYLGNDQRKDADLEAALATYDKGISYNPAFYANYIGRAQALEDKGDVAESVKAYIKAGEVSEASKKADKAEAMYSKAENIVAVAWGEKKWDDTQAYATAFLETKASPEVHYYLASALKESGDAAKAVEHADKAIELAGGDKSKYYMVKAESLEKLGQNDAAVAAYKQVSGSKYAERAQYKVKELSGGK